MERRPFSAACRLAPFGLPFGVSVQLFPPLLELAEECGVASASEPLLTARGGDSRDTERREAALQFCSWPLWPLG